MSEELKKFKFGDRFITEQEATKIKNQLRHEIDILLADPTVPEEFKREFLGEVDHHAIDEISFGDSLRFTH